MKSQKEILESLLEDIETEMLVELEMYNDGYQSDASRIDQLNEQKAFVSGMLEDL